MKGASGDHEFRQSWSSSPAWCFFVAGVATYALVSTTLAAQNITVSQDANYFAGHQVTQPWKAYARANVIGEHASEIADGKTYRSFRRTTPAGRRS
jgi:hypothetical protein